MGGGGGGGGGAGCEGGGGGGVLRISSDGDDQRIFMGLKFSIPEFFGHLKQCEDSW